MGVLTRGPLESLVRSREGFEMGIGRDGRGTLARNAMGWR